MNTLLVWNIKYRWYKFDYSQKQITDRQNRKFFSLQNFSFFYVDTKSEETPYKLKHWISSWFTQNTTRKITMNFTAFATDEKNRWDLLRTVNRIFEPPVNPSDTNKWFYEMEFTDPNNITWNFNAKVISRPKESDFSNSQWIDFEVELVVENWSCIYWRELQTLSDRNYIVGFPLPTPLWESFWYYSSTQINYQGISDSYVKCKITALQDNATDGYILIRSIGVNNSLTTLFINNTNLNLWDIIEIDPSNNLVTLNGVDITWDLELAFGNNFPVLQYLEFESPNIWNNQLVVDTWKYTQTVDVEWTRRDTRC